MKIHRFNLYISFFGFLKSLFMNSSESQKKLDKFIKKTTSKKYVVFTSMCRGAFYIVLKYLSKFKNKNEIIMASYNLKEMTDMVKSANHKLIMLNLSNNYTYNLVELKKNINKNTAAIILTNMFNDLEFTLQIKKLCERKGVMLIEDNAIYAGNHGIKNNRKIYSGEISDISLFSFGLVKNICSLDGGAIATNDKNLYKYANQFNKKNNKSFTLRNIKQICIFFIIKILNFKIIYNFIYFYISKLLHSKKINFILRYIYPAKFYKFSKRNKDLVYRKMSNFSLNLASQSLNENNDSSKKRFKNMKLYFQNLKNIKNLKLIFNGESTFQNFLDFPIIVENSNKLHKFLFNHGIECKMYYYKYCNNKKRNKILEKSLLCLPCNHNILASEIKYICDLIKKFLKISY